MEPSCRRLLVSASRRALASRAAAAPPQELSSTAPPPPASWTESVAGSGAKKPAPSPLLPHATHVSVVGCGFVGANTALALLQRNICSRITLTDVDEDKVRGEVLDLEDAAAPGRISAGTPRDAGAADVVVVTAGRGQRPGETRLDLIGANAKILESCLAAMGPINPAAKIVVVANPCDPLAFHAARLAGLPAGAVFGSGTVLDSRRLKVALAGRLGVHHGAVDLAVLGEHGDSQFAAYSLATVGGIPLRAYPGVAAVDLDAEATAAAHKAYDIIGKKKYTAYGVANATADIVDAILNDRKAVLPVSVKVPGRDCNISLPSVVGYGGVEATGDIRPHLDAAEVAKYDETVAKMEAMVAAL